VICQDAAAAATVNPSNNISVPTSLAHRAHSNTHDVSDASGVAARLLPISSSGFTASEDHLLPERASQELAAGEYKSAEFNKTESEETLRVSDVSKRNDSGAVASAPTGDYVIATVDSGSDSSNYVMGSIVNLPPDMLHPAGSPSRLREYDDSDIVEPAD